MKTLLVVCGLTGMIFLNAFRVLAQAPPGNKFHWGFFEKKKEDSGIINGHNKGRGTPPKIRSGYKINPN
ncbi:MAG: hypothetical protein ACJ75J_11335 [Cytophagaceae bacterium]